MKETWLFQTVALPGGGTPQGQPDRGGQVPHREKRGQRAVEHPSSAKGLGVPKRSRLGGRLGCQGVGSCCGGWGGSEAGGGGKVKGFRNRELGEGIRRWGKVGGGRSGNRERDKRSVTFLGGASV